MKPRSHIGSDNRRTIAIAVIVLAVVDFGAVTVTHAAAYAYAGVTISNFMAYWADSLADATDLNQGPNRDGTGRQPNTSDFVGTYAFGGHTNGTRVEFDTTRAFSSGVPEVCVGDCVAPENDFHRPPPKPLDPTSGLRFTRVDGDFGGNLISFRSLTSKLLGEMELDADPLNQLSFGESNLQNILDFSPAVRGELVFDFDADSFVRVLNHPAVPHALLKVSNSFQISIADSDKNVVFRYSPDGTGNEDIGGTVVADPFSLNILVQVGTPTIHQDLEQFGVGQFRVISPTLIPGNFYSIRVDHKIRVEAVRVPEPSTGILILMTAGVLTAVRRR